MKKQEDFEKSKKKKEETKNFKNEEIESIKKKSSMKKEKKQEEIFERKSSLDALYDEMISDRASGRKSKSNSGTISFIWSI